MKNLYPIFINFFIMLLLSFSLTIPTASAKSISLFDEPTTASNIVDTLNSSNGVILIYSPKDADWIKVANPKNGNVGWVKSSELSNSGAAQTTVTIAANNADGNKEVSTIMHFGQSVKITQEQAEAMVKKLTLKQQAVHQTMQHMVNNMNHLFQEEWKLFNQTTFPVLIPSVYQPAANKQVKSTTPTQDKSAKITTPLGTSAATKDI